MLHKAYGCPNCGRGHGEMTEQNPGPKLCPECAEPARFKSPDGVAMEIAHVDDPKAPRRYKTVARKVTKKKPAKKVVVKKAAPTKAKPKKAAKKKAKR